MFENKIYANKKLIEYFNNILEGFRYVLLSKGGKIDIADSEAVLKAKNVQYSVITKEFQKFYQQKLSKTAGSKSPVSKEEDKEIDKKIDDLTNNAVDKLETVVRKTGHTLPAKKQIVFKQAVLSQIEAEMCKNFNELKFLENCEFSV